MANPHNIKVGQTLYRVVVRRGEPNKIEAVTVGKVGNKNFYVNFGDEIDMQTAYKLETLFYEDKQYSRRSHALYFTEQDIIDENKMYEIRRKVNLFFKYKTFEITDQQYKDIAKILNIE